MIMVLDTEKEREFGIGMGDGEEEGEREGGRERERISLSHTHTRRSVLVSSCVGGERGARLLFFAAANRSSTQPGREVSGRVRRERKKERESERERKERGSGCVYQWKASIDLIVFSLRTQLAEFT